MFTSGDVLFSRFEVLSPSPVVETPAFSIWRARDRKREQDVAVKVYHEDVVKSALDRFNALKSAKDKYLIGDVEILRQYSVYKHGDKIKFLLMDGVGDPPSPNGLDSVRSVETIAEIALQILKIIRCAHENGIVLGAFSWSDFLFSTRGVLRLGDLRHARITSNESERRKDLLFFCVLLAELHLQKVLDVYRNLIVEERFSYEDSKDIGDLPDLIRKGFNYATRSKDPFKKSFESIRALYKNLSKSAKPTDKSVEASPSSSLSSSRRPSKSEDLKRKPEETKEEPAPLKKQKPEINIDKENALEISIRDQNYYLDKNSFQSKILSKMSNSLFSSSASSTKQFPPLKYVSRWNYNDEIFPSICENLIRYQSCRDGDSCRNIHPAVKEIPPLPKGFENSNKVCVKFVKGQCDPTRNCPIGYYHWTLDEELGFLVKGQLPNLRK